jgi:hypothetical protein
LSGNNRLNITFPTLLFLLQSDAQSPTTIQPSPGKTESAFSPPTTIADGTTAAPETGKQAKSASGSVIIAVVVSLMVVTLVVGALWVRRRRQNKGRASNLTSESGGGMFFNPTYQGMEPRSGFEHRGLAISVAADFDEPNYDLAASLGRETEAGRYLEPSSGQGEASAALLPDHYITPKLASEGRTQHVSSDMANGAKNGASQDVTDHEYIEAEDYSTIKAIPDYAEYIRVDDGYEQPTHDSSVAYAQPGDARGSAGEDIYQVSMWYFILGAEMSAAMKKSKRCTLEARSNLDAHLSSILTFVLGALRQLCRYLQPRLPLCQRGTAKQSAHA